MLLKLRKVYEVVGYSLDGYVICVSCSDDEIRENGSPIFLQDAPEDEENSLHCETCSCNLAD